ncbi:MAG: NAD(P)-binding domain-containing protein, partial [Methyloligellaceae bacterium]
MNIESVGVIGGGAWGTALAQSCCVAGRSVRLWAFEQETVDSINATHKNKAYLPDASLDPKLVATVDREEVGRCDIVLMVAPAQHVRNVSEAFAPHIA